MSAAVGQSIGLDRQLIVCLVGNVPRCTRHRQSRQPHKKLPVTFVMMNNPEYNVLKSFMRSQPSYLSARSNRFVAMNIEQPASNIWRCSLPDRACPDIAPQSRLESPGAQHHDVHVPADAPES
jgi:benzoylformate decarboxylase